MTRRSRYQHHHRVARAEGSLTLERMQEIAKLPGGSRMLREHRSKLQQLRDQNAAYWTEQLAEMDKALRNFDLAIDGGVQA